MDPTSHHIADLGETVVYQGGLDGHVAADPVIHIGPVLPQGVSVVLYTAALDTKPGKYGFLKRVLTSIGYDWQTKISLPKTQSMTRLLT